MLHPTIQRWIWKQGWRTLRTIQEQAILPILSNDRDVLISASTAGGKTEAAFLPTLSDLLFNPTQGVAVLGIIPLKALINDQHRRLKSISELAGIPVYAWHGDISFSQKSKALKKDQSVLLITPESLEALFVKRHSELKKAFCNLRRIVVDELHAFIGSERGMQLQSLMNRVDLLTGQTIPRIGLSATLGDMAEAAKFLRFNGELSCEQIISTTKDRDLRMQTRGYAQKNTLASSSALSVTQEIQNHLFKTLRGNTNLVFANSRQRVELFADGLRRQSDEDRVPNEFYPHHGNLSKELREEVEERLKKSVYPTTVICTNTLELGIDIGSVKSVAQLSVPPSVASLCQRIGRSGRQDGEPAILRNYLIEQELHSRSSIPDRLRLQSFHSIATTELLIDGWIEPPSPRQLHLSTLVQQLLSIICQFGGISPQEAWYILHQTGPFHQIEIPHFKSLLMCLGQKEVIIQSSDGALHLGKRGEKLVDNYRFYAAFSTPEEITVVCEGKTLGMLDTAFPIVTNSYLIFAGRRWLIKDYDEKRKIVNVKPASGGELPKFESSYGAMVHSKVRKEVRRLYEDSTVPIYLDATAAEFFHQGKATYQELGLSQKLLWQDGSRTYLVIWESDQVCFTLELLFLQHNVTVSRYGPLLIFEHIDLSTLRKVIKKIINSPSPRPNELVANLENKNKEKYDNLLNDELLNMTCSIGLVDVINAFSYLKTVE